MKIITDEKEKNELLQKFNLKKIKAKEFVLINNPWAKDKYGKPDPNNLACYIEFVDKKGESYIWLPTEIEFFKFINAFSHTKIHNLYEDSGGKEWETETQTLNTKFKQQKL